MIKKIKTKKILKMVGSAIEVGELFDIDGQSIYQWKTNIPELRAYQLREDHADLYYKLTDQ